MSRKKIVAGNWKMNGAAMSAADFIERLENWFTSDEIGKFASKAIEAEAFEVVVAPPFTSIAAAVDARRSDRRICIAAQNVHYEPKGAFTGEISLPMLEEAGCRYVIIGHSERRHIFGEPDELIMRKVISTLESEIRPILCVGETLEERESGNMEKVLKRQLTSALKDLTSDVVSGMVVIAYEPVWAIGTGKAASLKDADKACAVVRDVIEGMFGPSTADSMLVQYGGSVNIDNCSDLINQSNIDGLLIGGASLNVESFKNILAKTVPGSYRTKK